MEEQEGLYKLEVKVKQQQKCFNLIQTQLIQNEILEDQGYFRVKMIYQNKWQRQEKWFLVFTNFRMFIVTFLAPQIEIRWVYYLGDVNIQKPFDIKERKTEQQQDHKFIQIKGTGTIMGDLIIGVKSENFGGFQKHFQEHTLQKLKQFQLFDEEVQARILQQNPETLANYNRLVINSNEKIMKDEDFWKLNEDYQRQKGSIMTQSQHDERDNMKKIKDELYKNVPQPVTQPFSMDKIYEKEEKRPQIPNSLYEVQIENDLLLNMDDPDEGLRHFYRNRPSKKTKPEEKHQQIQAFENMRFIQDLQRQSTKEYIKHGINMEETIEDLHQKDQKHPFKKILSDNFEQQILQNEGAEFYQPLLEQVAPTISKVKKVKKVQHIKEYERRWDAEKEKVLECMNDKLIFEQPKRLDAYVVIADAERNIEISFKQRYKLEQKEKDFFKLARSMYSDVRRLLQLLNSCIDKKDRSQLENIGQELNDERLKIRQQIDKDKMKPENKEMKKQILEDLQKMIECGLNQLK